MRGATLGALVAVVLLSGCASPAPYEALLDEIDLPDTWEWSEREVVSARDGSCTPISGPACPQVTDRYETSDQPAVALGQAREAIADLGLEEQRLIDDCDDAQGAGTNCTVTGDDGEVLVQVLISETASGSGVELRAHASLER
jgi:hypothetical protein